MQAQTLPASSPTWPDLLTQALALRSAAQYDSALVLAQEALVIAEREYGTEDTSVARVLFITGMLDFDLGRYADAEPVCLRSLTIREKVLGPNHPDVAKSLNILGNLNFVQSRYVEAERLLKQALAIREKALGPDHPDVAQSLINLSNLYYDQSRYADAEQNLRRALAIQGKALGPDHLDVAWCLNNLGNVVLVQGRIAEAESLHKRALTIREKAFGPDHPLVALSYFCLTNICCDQGRYAEAESLCRRALAIREKVLGSDHLDVAQSLHSLANLCNLQGRYAESESLHRRALEIFEKALGPEHPTVALSLSNLSNVCVEQGLYDQAEPICRRALTIREKILSPEHPDVAQSLLNLANLCEVQGRYAEAEPLYERSLKIMEKAHGSDHPSVAQSLNNLAAHYADQGRFSDAEPLYRHALHIREKALGPEHPNIAESLLNLANLCQLQGRNTEAEPLYERALKMDERTLGADHPSVAQIMNNLASLYDIQARYAEAEPLYLNALQIRESALGVEHPNVSESLYNLANLYSRQNRYGEAEPLYEQAREIGERTLGPDHPAVAEVLSGSAQLAQTMAQSAKAIELESRAWSIRRQNFRDNAAVLTERSALEYSRFLTRETGICLSILLDAPDRSTADGEEIARVVLSGKGTVSDGIMCRYRSLDMGGDNETAELSDSLRNARFALSKLYVDGPGEDSAQVYRRKLDAATTNKEWIEAELARRSASFQREQELWDVNAQEIAEMLPVGGVHVELMRYNHHTGLEDVEPRYLAVVVNSTGNPSVSSLGPASAIDTAVYWYRQQFRNPQNLDQTTYSAAAENLYSLVWRPFAALLKGATTVFIAPDGNLNLVSFAGLKDDNGKYLIENYPIHYLSTGRDLLRLQDDPISGNGLLAIGDPDYDLSYDMSTASAIGTAVLMGLNLRSSCEELNKLHVASLPGTRTEISALSNQWKQNSTETVITYFGSDATEEQFKQNAPGKRVIHLATHGFYISDECKPKQGMRDIFGESGGYVGENPLLQCGFLLAGANKHGEGANETRREDGIVTAEEVAGLNIQGTDLVVLSSCESGLGEIKSGEGVYGLRRAFQMAGARTVVSALWPIDDKSTAEFMSELFSARDETLPQTMQRVALARLATLRSQGKSDHPFYWAAFVATGDFKPVR